MTTFEPGARLVFTHGLRVRPRSTAFLATRPAATRTLGLDVLVQLVMAATTTAPWSIASPCESAAAGAAAGVFRSASICGSAAANFAFAAESGTRSWGRFGPASDGSTLPRSRSITSL